MSGLRHGPRIVLTLAAYGGSVIANTEAGTVAPDMVALLKGCAAISATTERLACYDHLAGRESAPPGAPVTATASQPVLPPATPQAPSNPAPKESFGLYAAEHPAAPRPATAVTAKVVGLGMSTGGHPTVALDVGQLWELDGADPLLAKGDAVTIERAALGSFLMMTPGGRTHRVHRLK